MNILITSGAMREPIDDVRVITNISSGALGSVIADSLCKVGYNITYVSSKGSKTPINSLINKITASSFNEVSEALNNLVPKNDVIIHAMAVSDFSFKQNCNQKIHTKEDFVELIKNNILVNPKLLQGLRELNKKALIIGFKFEVGMEHNELITKARNQNIKCNIDWTLANDKIEMNRNNAHIGYLVSNSNVIKCNSKQEIAEQISKILENI